MSRLKQFILYCLLFFITSGLSSQELPVHEQYIFDYMLINPCFTGISGTTNVKLAHREQWVGIENSPSSSFLLVRHRLNSRNGGIGGYIFSDQNGPNSKYGLQVSTSFHFLLKSRRTKKVILSFGMSVRGTFHILDETKFDPERYDPIINYTHRKTFIPNANIGILLSNRKSFIGYSADNLIPYKNKIYNDSFEPDIKVVHNIHIGTSANVMNKRMEIKPTLSFQTNFNGLSQLDASARYYFLFNKIGSNRKSREYRNAFWVGAIYKQTLDKGNMSPLSLAPTFGLKAGFFTVSYLYDIGLTKLQTYHYGTHQVTIGLRFAQNNSRRFNSNRNPIMDTDF